MCLNKYKASKPSAGAVSSLLKGLRSLIAGKAVININKIGGFGGNTQWSIHNLGQQRN